MLKQLAKRIAYSMNMKDNDIVLIKAGLHEQRLVELIAIEFMKHGIDVFFSTKSDEFVHSSYNEIPDKYLRRISKLSLILANHIDGFINIEYPKDQKILEKISHKKFALAGESAKPITDILDKRKVKWTYVGYPTKELANQLNVSYSTLKAFIFDAILKKQSLIMKEADILKKKLMYAKKLHIYDEFGTDICIRIGRKVFVDDGFISDEDVKNNDVGNNLPSGEIFTAPYERKADGVIVSPLRRDYFSNKIIENIKLVFEKGRLNMKKSKAEKNEKLMKETIKHCIKIDRKTETRIGTTNIAEIGIGLNPNITKIIGYLLTDEKIRGTIHVAIGRNVHIGGKTRSFLHWDFVTNKGVNVETEKEIIISNGKVLKH